MKEAILLLILTMSLADQDPPKSGSTDSDLSGYVDFSDQATELCQVDGLWVRPPAGWISVPIDFGTRDSFAGCQMMLIENEALIGILRFVSGRLPSDVDPQQMLVGIEAQFIQAMNYELGGALWRHDDVPVSGDGFEEGKALGVSLSLPGNPNPMEGHFLTFRGPERHYIMTLLTPDESVEGGIHYRKTTAGLSKVMQTVQPGTSD